MSVGLDTSVVLRLLTGVPAEQAEIARAFTAGADSPVFVSDLVVGDAYYALMHHYRVPHLEAVRALAALIADPRVQSSGVARAVLGVVMQKSSARTAPGVLDRLIHADYARDDIRLATFDRELGRLAGSHTLG